jgi:predicted ribosomally synthesized peptide with SipW-like signal peptide
MITTLLLAALILALFAGSALAAYNDAKVKNKSFEKDSNGDGIPNAWSPLVLNAGSQRVCNQAKEGNCSFKMKADGTTSYLLQETLNSSGPAGVTATISGWMKGKDLLGAGVSSIGVQFNYTSGGGFACGAQAAGGTFGWTWFEADCVAAQSFDSMTVQLFTNESSGKVWFDKVKLTAVGP